MISADRASALGRAVSPRAFWRTQTQWCARLTSANMLASISTFQWSNVHNVSPHHPDHDVGEPSNPQGGGDKGQHEPVLPAWFGAVGDGEVEQQAERPGKQPLQFVANTHCKHTPQQLNNPQSVVLHFLCGLLHRQLRLASAPLIERVH